MDENKKIVLIVEDEEAISQMIATLVEEEGYTAIIATDGELGLEKAQEIKPDLILLDLMLPKLDGEGVLKALRAEGSPCFHTPVVVFTNVRDTINIATMVEPGKTDYMLKADLGIDEIAKLIRGKLK